MTQLDRSDSEENDDQSTTSVNFLSSDAEPAAIDENYSCDQCNKAFKNKHGLKVHTGRVHKKQISPKVMIGDEYKTGNKASDFTMRAQKCYGFECITVSRDIPEQYKNNPGLNEEKEFHTLNLIDSQDAKLPRLDFLIDKNKEKADMVLTDIQNSMSTKVKTVQTQLKKDAKNKLNNIIKDLGRLNNELEQTNDEATRDKVLEAREAFQTQYTNHFKREAEKTTYFRTMNLEKPTKWFLNLASK